MKNLLKFKDSILSKKEMKSITGGCGSVCCYSGGGCEQSAGFGSSSYSVAISMARECAKTPGNRGYWCCASC